MNVADWLRQAQQQLESCEIGTARLDALVLLEDATLKDRAWLLAHPEFELNQANLGKLEKLLSLRAAHEPLAYIRGKTEFYGREFLLTPDVLEPRPESETMIDLLKEIASSELAQSFVQKKDARVAQNLLDSSPQRPETRPLAGQTLSIADIGTGSGALGITVKLELPDAVVDLIDIDPKALKVAKMNVDKFTLNISTIESDLLADTQHIYDILLCNLPYVPDEFRINPAAMREPRIAIFGGPDGLDVYRKLFKQIAGRDKRPLYILSEALPPQHELLSGIAASGGYGLHRTEAFIQVFRREGAG